MLIMLCEFAEPDCVEDVLQNESNPENKGKTENDVIVDDWGSHYGEDGHHEMFDECPKSKNVGKDLWLRILAFSSYCY